MMKRIAAALALLLAAALPLSARAAAAAAAVDDHSAHASYWVYIGTYTGFKNVHNSKPNGLGLSHSQGIYVAKFNAATGELGPATLAASIINPSFLTVSPDHKYVYAVSEDPTSVGPPLDHESFVSAFSIDQATGKLHLLNTVAASGTSSCFISIDRTGRYVFVASFGSGNLAVIHTRPDGSLGETTAAIQHLGHGTSMPIQYMPHPHCIQSTPDNKYVMVSDLGLDKIYVYRFDDKTGALSPYDAPYASVTPGGGPRHFTFSADGKFLYQLSEMSGHVDVFSWHPDQDLLKQEQLVSTIPDGFNGGNHSAEIYLRPDGKFLYESNRRTHPPNDTRGPDTIGVYAVNPQNGTLTFVEQADSAGIMPRSFGIDPTGHFLLSASELNNTIAVLSIDQATGKLTPTGKVITADTPVCIQFTPAR